MQILPVIWAVLLAAQLHGAVMFWSWAAAVILDVDWDVVLSIVLGLAGIGYVVIDHRRVSKLDEWGQSLGERVAAIEATLATSNPQTLPERVAALEAQPELTEDVASLRERMATVEARIDWKQITHTRGAKGRFASPGGDATCVAPETK